MKYSPIAPLLAVALAAVLSASAQTNSTPSVPEAAVIEKLLGRIELLEQREAERQANAEAAQKTHEQDVQKFVTRIRELESKVTAIESARVLPEISIPAQAGPTTEELDQKIRIAERHAELTAEASEAKAKDSPKLSISQNGVSFSSADTNFVVKLRGLVQLDGRKFFDDNPRSEGNDTFLLRRARPIIEGTFFRDFDFQIVPDFGGSSVQLVDAFVNYRARPELQFKAGKFKGPVGLEQLQSDATLPFNERSLVTGLVSTRNVGVQLWGDIAEGALGYAIGAFNQAGDGRNPNNNDFNDNKEIAGRIFAQPFKSTERASLQAFGVGLAGSWSQVRSNSAGLPSTTGGTLPGYATEAQQQFFAYNPSIGTVVADGEHWRLSPQLSYLFGPFGLIAEYGISHQEVANSATGARAALEHHAWQVGAQWMVTGELASFTGIVPERPFNWRTGGWGAWQLMARYSNLSIDDAAFGDFSDASLSASEATAWSVGINWWLNKNVRVLTSFTHTTFDGGGNFNPLDSRTFSAPATVTAQDENALFTRIQIGF
ncbi:MAG: porin [Akkermansiaceae bacterium]|nr:porin [Verrucomicrobiales bacterium]